MVNNFKKLSIKKVSKVAFNMFAICFISVICLMGAKTVYAEEGKKTISAKEQMEQEEKYIVDLVSQRTIQNLTTANWRECLCYLREHYDSLMKEEGIETNKIQSYVNAYTFVEMDEKEPEEKTNFFIETYAAYSPAKVTAYTNKYWKNYNSAYPNFTSLGGDCANFVSQALYDSVK